MSANRRYRRQKRKPPGWDQVIDLWKQGRFPPGTVGEVQCWHDASCNYPKDRTNCTCRWGPDLRIITKENEQ